MIKKIFLFIICILLSVPASAQQADFIYTIDNFSKGQRSHVSDYLIKDGEAAKAQNIRVNDDYGAIAKREKRLILSSCHSAPVKSLYRYYLSNNTQHTISASSTYLDAIDDDGNCTALYASATDGKRWSFVTYKDMLIGMDGTDNAKKWDGAKQTTSNTDGSRTANDLVADLGAPFAELNTGSNLDASSWYQYKVAFYNGSYYTYSTARSNPIQTGSTVRDITLTDIPLGPSGTTERYIYRTEGKASRVLVIADTSFKKIATISDNTTTTYNDTMTDATWASDAVPTWSTVSGGYEVTPPKSKYAVINRERLFIANDPSGVESGKSTLYYSKEYRPDYFYFSTDYDLIRPDDGDEITFIKNLLGTLTIGKTRTISKFYTEASDTDDWTISDPYSFIGCDSPWSAVNGISGIIYLGRYGIYNFSGQSSELISDVVTDRVRDILETNRDEVFGIYNDNKYYMAYTSAEGGSSDNDKVLVFDITRNAYVEDTSHVDSFANYDSGSDSGTLYSGSSETDGTIYAYGTGFSKLLYRTMSALDSGTPSHTYITGTEDSPILTLGEEEAWSALGAGTWSGSGSWTWSSHSLTGTWLSPITQINASSFDKLYWNEALGPNGDATVAVRVGSTAAAVSSASWSSEFSDPSGSDLSSLTANNYIQLRVSLSSTSWEVNPALFTSDSFLLKLYYSKSGSQSEPNYQSIWQSGKLNLGAESSKRIKEMQVFYSGTSGTLTITYENESGNSTSFDIDMSVNPSDLATDRYFGTTSNKIYSYIPSFDSTTTGRIWQFKVSENGTATWKVKRMLIRGETLPYTSYQGTL